MKRSEFAEKLVLAKSGKERNFLLAQNRRQADEKLAVALKEICYAAWTTEPTKAIRAWLALENLAAIIPLDSIKAYAFWVCGIARITEGKLDSAIENLDAAAVIFRRLKREHEAANTQVAKIYSLALLGRSGQAVKIGAATLEIFERYGDSLAAGKVEMNLANLLSRHEQHERAKRLYLSAHRRFLALGEIVWLTMSENGLAITYAALNDFRRAEQFYEQALTRARKARMPVTEAEIEASIGSIALFRGHFDRALRFLESSRQRYDHLSMPHQTAIARLEIADVYLELNLTEEAAAIYEPVADELQRLKLPGEEARARANFGRVAVSHRETDLARAELKKSARLYLQEKNPVGAAAVKLSEATLELTAKNHRKVLKLAREAERLLEKSDNIRHRLTARWLRAEALCRLGETENARRILIEIYHHAVKNEQPNLAQSAQVSLGSICAKEKNYRCAERHFKRAIRLIESLRAPLAAEEFRMAFLANKLAPYEKLAQIYLAENKLPRAFAMIERSKARVLAESLNRQTANDSTDNHAPKLTERLENLREELNWFYSRLNRADEAEIKLLQIEAQRREREIAEISRQIESTRPTDETNDSARKNYSATDAAKLKQLQNQLGEHRALIEFVNFDGAFSAFVITDKKIHLLENLVTETEIAALLEKLRFQFDALRYGARHVAQHLDELKKRADFYLRTLHEKLFAPLEKFVADKNLIVVPVGAAHYIPFHALTDGTKYLIENREIVSAPSATVWSFLASKSFPKLKTALLFGFADERIPFVNREIEILRGCFARRKTFTGERATFAAFAKNAGNFDVLHFACHGNFRPENPMFSSLHLADGWVTVRDICAKRLQAEIVTLSACETGLHKVFAGDEILGLARGFLSAGAKSLILSLWTVNDEATTELMKNFYAELQAGKSAAAALQSAQRDFIKRGEHPYFWSPFALIGR